MFSILDGLKVVLSKMFGILLVNKYLLKKKGGGIFKYFRIIENGYKYRYNFEIGFWYYWYFRVYL